MIILFSVHVKTYMKFSGYLLLFLLMACGISDSRDIYKTVPIGAVLTKEIFIKSGQIISNGSDLILVFDDSKDVEYYDPHLLFFDSARYLYAACYFSSEKIEALKNDTIKGFLNSSRNERKSWYRNDLPAKYNLYLQNLGENSSGRICNKIIDSILIDSISLDVTFFVRKSKDLYSGIGWERNMDADSAFFADFAVYDTLKIPLAELLFDKEERLITTRTSDPSTTLISDQMIVYNKSTLDKFYDQIFGMIVRNRKGSQ
jgi:hypothetical protein